MCDAFILDRNRNQLHIKLIFIHKARIFESNLAIVTLWSAPLPQCIYNSHATQQYSRTSTCLFRRHIATNLRKAFSLRHDHVSLSFSRALPIPSSLNASEQCHSTTQQPSAYLSTQHIANFPTYPGLSASLNLCHSIVAFPTTPRTQEMATNQLRKPSLYFLWITSVTIPFVVAMFLERIPIINHSPSSRIRGCAALTSSVESAPESGPISPSFQQ